MICLRWRLLKYKFLKIIAKIKRTISHIEDNLREDPPNRLFGLPLMIGGFLLNVLGAIMLIFPGPGILAIVFGTTGILFGFRLIMGKYDENFDE